MSESLRRWYPNSNITGSDRDINFIEFAKQNIEGVSFIEADINNLPCKDNSFDVTISHTVQEHVAPDSFFGEQYRVLKKGGICLVLSSRRGINILPSVLTDLSDFEKDMVSKTDPYFKATDEIHGVCKYPMSEQELPLNMDIYGFKNISTHYIPVNLTPDSSDIDDQTAVAFFEANRQVNLDVLSSLSDIAPNVISKNKHDKWRDEINRRYDKRIDMYKNGEKLWDTYVSIIMVVRGVK